MDREYGIYIKLDQQSIADTGAASMEALADTVAKQLRSVPEFDRLHVVASDGFGNTAKPTWAGDHA
jgi:hypothetical protein